jgi:hypothetical protein
MKSALVQVKRSIPKSDANGYLARSRGVSVDENHLKRQKIKGVLMKRIYKLKETLPRLRELDLDPLAAVVHGATTTNTLHDGVVATATAVAGIAVKEVVTLLARFGALVLALEDTGVHVG